MAKPTSFMTAADRSVIGMVSNGGGGETVPVKQLEPPAFLTGCGDEIESLSLNETLADAMTAFDAIYLPYPRHKSMQIAIDRVRQHGLRAKGSPMRGLRVSGPTGSGKTTGIAEYVAHLRRQADFDPETTPVLYIGLRRKTTVTKVLRTITAKFGDRHGRHRDELELNEQVHNCIRRAKVQLIVLDECQHLRNLSNESQQVTDQFKVFLDDSIAPVIFVGTYDADPMFAANKELCNRLASPIDLAPLRWDNTDDRALFTEFMRRLDDAIVERDLVTLPSGLDQPYQLACLYLASGGVIGTAYRIVREAMLVAISRDAEMVEGYDLALAVSNWAMPLKLCAYNPFLRADLRRLADV